MIVLEPPAVTVTSHAKISNLAIQARRSLMEEFGTPSARSAALAEPGPDQIRKVIEHRPLQAQLTPLRSWRRKNASYQAITSKIDCRAAIFLFSPDQDDLRISEPDYSEPTNEDSIVPTDRARIYFLSEHEPSTSPTSDVYRYKGLDELVSCAWMRFRGSRPENFVETDCSSMSMLYIFLPRALHEDRPLRFGARRSFAENGIWPGKPDSDEVVLIEPAADAENLCGVLYATMRGAHLVCTETPKPGESRIRLESNQQCARPDGGVGRRRVDT
jgi:hypothetical protein